jgi:hypothetical protein
MFAVSHEHVLELQFGGGWQHTVDVAWVCEHVGGRCVSPHRICQDYHQVMPERTFLFRILVSYVLRSTYVADGAS